MNPIASKLAPCLAAAAILLAGCGTSTRVAAPAVDPVASTPPARAAAVAPAPTPTPSSSSAPKADSLTEEDEALLLHVLEESGFALWTSLPMPQDPDIRAAIVNGDQYSIPCVLSDAAVWYNGGVHGTNTWGVPRATAEELCQIAQDLYGVEYSLEYAWYDDRDPGYYAIQPHGPGYDGRLQPDTVRVEGDTISVDTVVYYYNYGDGDPESDTETLRHTFTKNPNGAAFPFRLVRSEIIGSSTVSTEEDLAPATNTYPVMLVGVSNVDELNLRAGPGTEYDKLAAIPEGYPFFIVGDDGGEWLRTTFCWVKAEFVTILGSVED